MLPWTIGKQAVVFANLVLLLFLESSTGVDASGVGVLACGVVMLAFLGLYGILCHWIEG